MSKKINTLRAAGGNFACGGRALYDAPSGEKKSAFSKMTRFMQTQSSPRPFGCPVLFCAPPIAWLAQATSQGMLTSRHVGFLRIAPHQPETSANSLDDTNGNRWTQSGSADYATRFSCVSFTIRLQCEPELGRCQGEKFGVMSEFLKMLYAHQPAWYGRWLVSACRK